MATNEVSLIKVRELSRNLSKEDRHTPHLQGGVKRIDDRWSKTLATLEDRQKQLTAALESGPPKQFLSTMDSVLLKIKNMETQLASEFLIADTASLEAQLQKYKVSCYAVETAPLFSYCPLSLESASKLRRFFPLISNFRQVWQSSNRIWIILTALAISL